jgi:hypothetical protein
MLETVIVAIIVSVAVSFVVVRTISPRGSTVLIRDSKGHPRVELIAEPRDVWPQGMVGLRFLTRKGEHRLGLGLFEDEGTLAILDQTGLPRISVRIEETHPRIIFWQATQNAGGTRRIVLGLKTEGSHALEFFDDNGSCRSSIGIRKNGTSFFEMYDSNGNIIWKAS